MFTGIVESTGVVRSVTPSGSNKTILIAGSLAGELKVDQSVSHNGVCLTVEHIENGAYQVTAIAETLKKSNLDQLKPGDIVNLERCMIMGGRLDGHIVQGHVDTTAKCTELVPMNGSWEYRFEFPARFSQLIIEKGSISLNGISLTVFDVRKKSFRVAIIPYTYENTNIRQISPGSLVNLEFDMIGKYVQRLHQANK